MQLLQRFDDILKIPQLILPKITPKSHILKIEMSQFAMRYRLGQHPSLLPIEIIINNPKIQKHPIHFLYHPPHIFISPRLQLVQRIHLPLPPLAAHKAKGKDEKDPSYDRGISATWVVWTDFLPNQCDIVLPERCSVLHRVLLIIVVEIINLSVEYLLVPGVGEGFADKTGFSFLNVVD